MQIEDIMVLSRYMQETDTEVTLASGAKGMRLTFTALQDQPAARMSGSRHW